MTSDQSAPWLPGQRAIIDRRTVVTIDRVTPSGRAVVGNRTFEASGRERGGDSWRYASLEHLTPEIEAETALVVRGRVASEDAYKAIETANSWLRRSLGGGWGGHTRIPDAPDVDRAERLVAAIRQVMEGVG